MTLSGVVVPYNTTDKVGGRLFLRIFSIQNNIMEQTLILA